MRKQAVEYSYDEQCERGMRSIPSMLICANKQSQKNMDNQTEGLPETAEKNMQVVFFSVVSVSSV
ncbi:MAG: hypothetical protein IJF07_02650 [Lachnospiraceae bacterium]|nr:hypothetical protein [Lachnospiraceae bacterium]